MQGTSSQDEESQTLCAIEESLRQRCNLCQMSFKNMDEYQSHIAFECQKIYDSNRENPDLRQNTPTTMPTPSGSSQQLIISSNTELEYLNLPNQQQVMSNSPSNTWPSMKDDETNHKVINKYVLNEPLALSKKRKACDNPRIV